eukprot:GEMP01031551.1.p1 GENE.GEMP01031551.1~~GEMP01031551.1.p1  ORF type:complete len:177 (+),score=20.99 GEMP01031551.1:105-635(+)
MFPTVQYLDSLRVHVKDRQGNLQNLLGDFEFEINAIDDVITQTEDRIKEMEDLPINEQHKKRKRIIEGFRTCSDLGAKLELMDLSLQRIEQAYRVGHIGEHDQFRRLSFEVSFRLDSIRDLRQRCQYMYSIPQPNSTDVQDPNDVEAEPPNSWINIVDLFSCVVPRKLKPAPHYLD